ncbi:MAG TPA: NAD(P)-dependent oxidoreductase [Patescibacteria group bacterium]|nr:NAD(P)-dependent oxidoreductase [Patescibacteria group bacterium]
MKIAFFEIAEWEKSHCEEALKDNELLFTDQKVQHCQDQSFFQAEIISPFIYSTLNKETLQKFPNLRLITTRSTGYDHIDLAYCQEKGITVANVPSYGAHSVAEHTLALIFAISRKIIESVNRSRRGDFGFEGLRGFDISGKTLGVIGSGKIGTKVIKLALALEMKVLVSSHHPEELPKDPNLASVSFDEVISKADIVTLHVPYTQETHHMINRDNLKQFKKGSVLINTARGGLIETRAILEGLEQGIFRGVGLDVLEEENFLKEEKELQASDFLNSPEVATRLLDHMLLDRDDVLYTSHNAFNSEESDNEILRVTHENITAFIVGSAQNTIKAS